MVSSLMSSGPIGPETSQIGPDLSIPGMTSRSYNSGESSERSPTALPISASPVVRQSGMARWRRAVATASPRLEASSFSSKLCM